MTDKPDGKRRGWLALCGMVGIAALVAVWYLQESPPKLTPQEARILAIARAAVAARPDLSAHTDFDKPIRINPVKGNWSVTVWRLPHVPGGFVDVEIDRNEKVTGIMPGA